MTRIYTCMYVCMWVQWAHMDCVHLLSFSSSSHRKAFINVQLIFMRSTWISLCLIVFDHHHHHRQRIQCCMCNCHLFNTSMELGVWLHLLSVFSTRATKSLCLICFYCRFKINASKHNEKNNNSKLEWNCINAKDISDKSSLLWAIYWDFITLARSHSHSSLSFFLFFISYSDKINCTVTQIHHKKFALLVMRVESIDMVLPVRTFFFG